MDAIIVLIGLFIGLAIFMAVMSNITAIIYNCTSVAITFGICWGIGIVLAWIAWKIAIIIGIIALIAYIVGKVKGPKKTSAQQNTESASENPQE